MIDTVPHDPRRRLPVFMMNVFKALLVAMVLAAAPPVSAEQDIFFLGSGRAGFASFTSTSPQVVNHYASVTGNVQAGATKIPILPRTADHTTFLGAGGKLALVLQTEGNGLTVSSNPPGINLELSTQDGGKVGRWEFVRIGSVNTAGTELSFNEPLVHAYDALQAQVILVPEYTSLYVAANASLVAREWDPVTRTGGVIALLVQSSLINQGVISAEAAGFKGGLDNSSTCGSDKKDGSDNPAEQGAGLDPVAMSAKDWLARWANGGGGGACSNAGGGGGGGYGAGGRGGGTSLSTSPSFVGGGEGGSNVDHYDFPGRLVLGGGGGAGNAGGDGGNGGGAIFIRAGSLAGTGIIKANGQDGTYSAPAQGQAGSGGGGGAGGTIILRVAGNADCPTLIATGGKGGTIPGNASNNPGPGGGGGGGRILFQLQIEDVSSCLDFDAVAGGDKGVAKGGTSVDRGAVDGLPGLLYVLDKALSLPGNAVVDKDKLSPMRGGVVNDATATVIVKAPVGRSVFLSHSGVTVGPVESSTEEYPFVLTGLVTGSKTVETFAEYQGLRGPKSPFTFQVDNTPPSTSLPSVRPPNPTNSRSARFVFESPESNATFECDLDGAGWTPCSKDTTYHELVARPEPHVLKVRAVDVAGNEDPVGVQHSWIIDQTAPLAPGVTTPSANAFLKELATYDFAGNNVEAESEVFVYIDDAQTGIKATVDQQQGRWSATSVLEEGPHRVRVLAKDKAGNSSPFSSTVSFTVDKTPPPVGFTYPGTAPVHDSPLLVRGTTEVRSTVEVTLIKDGTPVPGSTKTVQAALGEWRYEFQLAADADGTYVVQATAKDAATNVTPTPATHPITLDRTLPDTAITCPARYTNALIVDFSFTPSEQNTKLQCVLNDDFMTTPIECPTSLDKREPWADGTYTLLARAVDAAGNVEPTPASCTWTWDRTPPGAVTLLNEPAQPYFTDERLLVFEFQPSDPSSEPVTYECFVEGLEPEPAEFHSCTNPYVVTIGDNVESADYTLHVRAKDLALNPSAAVKTFPWSLDTNLPVAVINPGAGAGNPTKAREANFVFTLKKNTEGAVQYRYILDDLETDEVDLFKVVNGDSVTIPVTLPGKHSIRVLARDLLRGVDTPGSLRDVYQWEVDWSPPDVSITSKPAPWVREPIADFEFLAPGEQNVSSFQCALSNCVSSVPPAVKCSGLVDKAQASYQVPVELHQEGRNCINVWAEDLAGNLSISPATYEWNLDTEDPQPPVINSQQGELNVGTSLPVVEGSSEPFADVVVFLDNEPEPVAQVGASAEGRWRAPLTQTVLDGSHSIRALAKDRAGNESPLSESVTLLVDTKSPAHVVGGGLSCGASGPGGSLLALLLGMGWLLVRGKGRQRG